MTRFKRILSTLAVGTALAATAGQAAPPNSQTVPVTHVVGNPKADVQLVEYVSYTCSHCADFEVEAGELIKLAYVSSTDLAVEIRHIVRDPVDMTVALLAHCGDADRFSANHHALMRSQKAWIGAISATTEAQRRRYDTGTLAARYRAIAGDAGLYEIMEKRGYSAGQVDRCLDNEPLARALASATRDYVDNGVKGTPSFSFGGEMLHGVHTWAALKPELDKRVRKGK